MEYLNNNEQPQQGKIFFENGYCCHRYKEDDGSYDIYVVFKVLSPSGFKQFLDNLIKLYNCFGLAQ